MALARGIQFATIQSGQAVSTPAFRLPNAALAALMMPSLGTSTMLITMQAANGFFDRQLGGVASASYLPVQRSDFGGAWQMVSTGSFSIALAADFNAFDEFRVIVSSTQTGTLSLSLLTKNPG